MICFRTGGRLLITDNLRENSVFDISPKSKKMFFESIERDGSNLGHVMTICSWEDDNTHNIERYLHLNIQIFIYDLVKLFAHFSCNDKSLMLICITYLNRNIVA